MRAWLEYQLVELFDVELPLLAGTRHRVLRRRRCASGRAGVSSTSPLRPLRHRGALHPLTGPARTSPPTMPSVRRAQRRPTLRPDELTDPTRPAWRDAVESAGVASYDELLAHLRTERQRSAEHGRWRPTTATPCH